MRLICPNCAAQYEVPDEVMPEQGRDVQCSNCGQTWYQEHPDHAGETDGDDEGDRFYLDEDDEDFDPDEEVAYADAPEPEPEPAPPPPPEPAAQAPARKQLDPSVAEILREEAEREAEARRSSPASLESQPELGLEAGDATGEAARRAREARERMARIRGEDADIAEVSEAAATAAAIGSRRDLLPDIEEINSTLRSSSDRAANGDPAELAALEAARQRGGRRGFTLMILLAASLALLYIYAPRLAEMVPGADPWISAYVGAVDQWRMWLDAKVADLLGWLDAAASSSAPGS